MWKKFFIWIANFDDTVKTMVLGLFIIFLIEFGTAVINYCFNVWANYWGI